MCKHILLSLSLFPIGESWLPGSWVSCNQTNVDDVTKDDNDTVENELELPLAVFGSAKGTHPCRNDDAWQSIGHNGGKAIKVPVEGGGDVPVGKVASQIPKNSET